MNLRFKKFWEIYLFYYALNCVVVLYDLFMDQTETTTLAVVEILLLIFGAYGLYGFIYQKRLINRLFWQIFCVPFTVFLSYSFFNVVTSDYDEYFSAFVVAVLISLLLIVPFTYAMLKYSYFSDRIWSNTA